MADQKKVVETTGTAAAGSSISARAIEEAMTNAAAECHRKGITDDDEIREAKLAARQRVKDDFAKQQARAEREARAAARKS